MYSIRVLYKASIDKSRARGTSSRFFSRSRGMLIKLFNEISGVLEISREDDRVLPARRYKADKIN